MNIRKFLEFKVSDQTFAIDVWKVQEVANPLKTTPLPEVPSYVQGIGLFRGRPVAVLDLRKRFNTGPGDRGKLIVLKPNEESLAVVVDSLVGIRSIEDSRIEEPKRLYRGIKSRFIDALYRVQEEVVVVLKMEELLSTQEKIVLKKALRNWEETK